MSALPKSIPLHLTQAARGLTHSWTSSVCNLGCSALNGSLHSDSHSYMHKHITDHSSLSMQHLKNTQHAFK